jgi:hypothetical protein
MEIEKSCVSCAVRVVVDMCRELVSDIFGGYVYAEIDLGAFSKDSKK